MTIVHFHFVGKLNRKADYREKKWKIENDFRSSNKVSLSSKVFSIYSRGLQSTKPGKLMSDRLWAIEESGLIEHLWWQLKLNIRLSSSEILGSSPLITTDEVIGRKLEPFHLPIPKHESKQSLFLNALKAEKANGWQSFVFENRR